MPECAHIVAAEISRGGSDSVGNPGRRTGDRRDDHENGRWPGHGRYFDASGHPDQGGGQRANTARSAGGDGRGSVGQDGSRLRIGTHHSTASAARRGNLCPKDFPRGWPFGLASASKESLEQGKGFHSVAGGVHSFRKCWSSVKNLGSRRG